MEQKRNTVKFKACFEFGIIVISRATQENSFKMMRTKKLIVPFTVCRKLERTLLVTRIMRVTFQVDTSVVVPFVLCLGV